MVSRKKGRKVPPTSVANIRSVANEIRKIFGLGLQKVDMIKFLEFVLPSVHPDFSYAVIPENEMGSDEARTYPDKTFMEIREDVYFQATSGDRRAQFTLAHELGHLILHSGIDKEMGFARGSSHEIYEDSEWQADTFASEFLMPFDAAVKCADADEISNEFGVSITAASVRFEKIN